MNRPNFFIIGAPKCGTTAIAHYLSQHPEVYMTKPKEPHYYNTDLKYGSYRDRSRYFSLFSDAKAEHKAIGEASVWYLYSREAVGNILADFPDARFLVMLRNPIEMAQSLHRQMVFSGYEDVQSFSQAWEMQGLRRSGKVIPKFCPEPTLLQYRDACSLGFQYERLLKQFDRDRLFAIVFDDFKFDPGKVWKALLEFLEVNDDGRTEFPIVNAAKKRRSLFVKRVNDAYGVARRRFRLPALRTGVLTRLDRWNYKAIACEPLSPSLQGSLKSAFAEDVSRLSVLLERDLSHWVE